MVMVKTVRGEGGGAGGEAVVALDSAPSVSVLCSSQSATSLPVEVDALSAYLQVETVKMVGRGEGEGSVVSLSEEVMEMTRASKMVSVTEKECLANSVCPCTVSLPSPPLSVIPTHTPPPSLCDSNSHPSSLSL